MGRNSQLHHKGVEVMGSLQHIFAKPEYIEGINKDNPIILYPIILDDYDKFEQNSNLLYLSKDQFIKSEIPLFLLLLVSHEQIVQDAENGKKTFRKTNCSIFKYVQFNNKRTSYFYCRW